MGTRYVSRAVKAEMADTTAAPVVNAATGIQPVGPVPKMAALMEGAKPPKAKPSCVPMAMPDRRTRVSNISPYMAGHTPLAALYTTPDSKIPVIIIPTNEELQIALATVEVLKK